MARLNRSISGFGRHIWALRVFPLLRNHGIGSRLLIAAEQLLFEKGYRWSDLTVDKHEPRAPAL